MTKALHRAGIEVILDFAFAESIMLRPTFLSEIVRVTNFSGTGNTLNANQPVVRGMIVDSFCYWVEHMHVDRFRFDLASILARDSDGHPMSNPPLLWDIESDPALAGTKMIAEAWGAAGR